MNACTRASACRYVAVMPKKTKAAAALVAAAVRILQDERLRAQVIDVGARVTDKVKTWNATRGGPHRRAAVPLDRPGSRSIRSSSLPALSKVQRLETRVAKLNDAVAILRVRGDSEIRAALDGVDEAIERLRVALEVAEKLPRTKRSEISAQVAEHLDELEQSVRHVTIGRAGGA